MSRPPKRESTVFHGIPTPPEDSRMSMSTGTTPKRESVSVRWSDIPEDDAQERYNSVSENQNGAKRQRTHHENNMDSMQSNNAGPQNGLEVVGQNVKALIDAIEELKKIGLKKHATCLPELVLVGDQSSGKSSLMSAITDINLPQGSGTCTRCPTNIRTSEATTWRCEVSLQITYDYNPKSKSQPFPNWVERQDGGVTKPFKTTEDKDELGDILKWAQIATLNPDKDSSFFIPGTSGHARESLLRNQKGYHEQAIFSPNVISVSITGPRLPDLSFYDLPGLFKNARQDSEKEGPKFCEQLTMKYVKHSRALIICAMSMHNDPGVSLTKDVINRCKANDRCVGVLTMPDRMQGYHDEYNDIFQERAYILRHGYFVTKQPGVDSPLFGKPMAPNYHNRCLQEEKKFFNESDLWGPGGKWSEFRDRCGTSVIQKYLSAEFTRMIWESLPDIEKDVERQGREIKERLAALPEVSHDQVQFTVRDLLRKFAVEADNMLAGKFPTGRALPGKAALHGQDNFHNRWRILRQQFQAALEQMKPQLICTYPTTDGPPDRMQPRDEDQINLVSDEEEDRDVRKPTNKRQAPDDQLPRTPVKRSFRSRAQTPVTPVKQEIMASPSSMRRLTLPIQNSKFGPFCHDYLRVGSGGSWTIDDVEKTIEFYAIPGFPDIVNHVVKEEYALTSIEPWKYPLETFHDETMTMLRKHMNNVLADVLRNYKDTELYRDSKKHIEEFINHHEKKQRERLMVLYNIERAALFTTNLPGFKFHKQQALDKLNAARREARIDALLKDPAYRGPNDKDQVRKNIKEEDLKNYSLCGREINVVAYVIGYYHLAKVRFVEAVCGNTKVGLFVEMNKGIENLLEHKFGLLGGGNADEICAGLLSGNAALTRERNELLATQKKLEAAIEVLTRVRAQIEASSDGDSDATVQHDRGMELDDPENDHNAGERRGGIPYSSPDDAPIAFAQ